MKPGSPAKFLRNTSKQAKIGQFGIDMSMKLPFLKNRRMPRISTEPMGEKLAQGSASDHLEDHMTDELMDAVASKDVKQFRSAVEALLMNMFDWSGDAANEG